MKECKMPTVELQAELRNLEASKKELDRLALELDEKIWDIKQVLRDRETEEKKIKANKLDE